MLLECTLRMHRKRSLSLYPLSQEGLTPRAVCDKYFLKHKAIYDWFDIRCA